MRLVISKFELYLYIYTHTYVELFKLAFKLAVILHY